MDDDEQVATIGGWRTRLQPWLETLERGLRVKIPSWTTVSDTDTEQPWVGILARVKDESSSAAGWVMLVEAMELLELLARVDKPLAWHLLTNLSEFCCPAWIQHQYKDIQVLPRFKLTLDGYALFNCEDATFEGLDNMTMPSTQHSATYSAVKALLLGKWAESHDGQAFHREREGYVEVSFKFSLPDINDPGEAAVERVFSRAESFVRSLRSCVTSFPCETSPFFLSSLTLGGHSLEPVPTAMLTSINRIGSIGIPVANVNIVMLETEQLDPDVLHEFLETRVASGLSKLSIGAGFFDLSGVEAFCLAIAHSRSLRHLEWGTKAWYEEGADDDDFDRWLWLAYALFSPDASHEIRSLGLNMEILDDVSCVDAMRQLLSSDDPLAYVDAYTAADQGADVDVQSTAGAAVLSPSVTVHRGRRGDRMPGQDPVSIKVDVAYRVVRNQPDEDFIELLVPRVGICWSQRSDVLEIRPVAQRETHPVRHLRLMHIEAGCVSPSIAFLALIGGPLEHLTIESLTVTGADSARLFNAILTRCPNLQRLNLSDCSIASLEALCSRETKLESVVLSKIKVLERDSLNRLFDALGDPAQPLAQSLRHLHIDCKLHMNDSVSIFGPTTPESCLAMLKQNHRLQRFEVVNCHRALPESWHSKFSRHQNEPLQGRLAPLPPAETLAFLSVVTPEKSASESTKKLKTASTSQSVRFKLDDEVLRLILELAALPLRRTCVLTRANNGS